MNNIVIKKMHDLFTGKDDEPVLIMSESGMPILETMSGVTMPADYSFECINNFVHRESPEYEDLQYLALGMSSYIEKLEAQIAAQEQTINHWKSNHDHMVTKAAFLSQRPDLPVDRIPAYRELEKLRVQISATTPQPAAQAGNSVDRKECSECGTGYRHALNCPHIENGYVGSFLKVTHYDGSSTIIQVREGVEDAFKPYAAQPAPADNVRGKQ